MDIWPDGLDRAPVMIDEIVLETDRYVVRKLWQWNIAAAYPSHTEPGLVKCLLWGQAFNYYGCSTYIRETGERLSSDVYLYMGDFSCGRAAVYVEDRGYGYIDRNADLVIPPVYQSMSEFREGYAICKRDDVYRIVDTSGRETVLSPDIGQAEYVGEGLFRIRERCEIDHPYDHDYFDCFGRWCYIDAHGRAITDRDVLYAFHFSEGIAIAARADWTRIPESTPGSMPRYTCDGERWGAIDTEGRTVIPFVFDEIMAFWDEGESGAYKAHFGGWESGAWGVIDRTGNWIVEPQFGYIGYEYVHGRFTFCAEDSLEDIPWGLYSVPEGRVMLPDIYDEIELYETGDIWTEQRVSNNDGSETIERRMLDASGSIKFDVSRYRWIFERDGHYEAHLANGPTVEILDTDGRPLDSCDPIVFDTGGFITDRRCGLQDARGNILWEPKYDHLVPQRVGGLYYAGVDKKSGVIDERGNVLIPMMYENVSATPGGTYICTARGNCAAYRIEDRG